MVKDTVHTTVPDENYAMGLRYLEEREYKKAIEILRPYHDINTAVAFLSLDYNASACEILQALPPSAKRDYMMAIIYARDGKEQKAVQAYINSVKQDPSMKFRANLDPEISQLVKKYGVLQDVDNTTY
jgi:tetratricopeptide (TPR) repeat protein